MDYKRIGILGATSLVGECLLPLLIADEWQVTAFSRTEEGLSFNGVCWRQISSSYGPPLSQTEENIPFWICVASIWVLPDCFRLLEEHGVRRIVVLSSTSRFTKYDSPDLHEQTVAHRLADAEERLQVWAKYRDVEWVVLRPTLIYGLARDKNISEIARFIGRFGFFPLFGQAQGLRQPVHAEDVASACFAALVAPGVKNHAYNISGAETLRYREMVSRVFLALGRNPRFFTVPMKAFCIAVAFLRLLPRYRHWSAVMAERMNRDMVFDHANAVRDFGYCPRAFMLSRKDVSGFF